MESYDWESGLKQHGVRPVVGSDDYASTSVEEALYLKSPGVFDNAELLRVNKNVFLRVADRLRQTLPLYTNLGTAGVYVYARDFNIPGRSATATAETQVRNDHAGAKTHGYEVVVEDAAGGVR